MKIRKKEPSVGVLGKIINSFTSSKQDTYSADYINNKITSVEDNLKATVLYEDNIGTMGTVNLSQSLAQFKYIDVFGYEYASSSKMHKRIESPGIGTVYFNFSDLFNAEGLNTITLKTKKYNLSENKIEVNAYGDSLTVEINVISNTISASNKDDTIYINKVVGYK